MSPKVQAPCHAHEYISNPWPCVPPPINQYSARTDYTPTQEPGRLWGHLGRLGSDLTSPFIPEEQKRCRKRIFIWISHLSSKHPSIRPGLLLRLKKPAFWRSFVINSGQFYLVYFLCYSWGDLCLVLPTAHPVLVPTAGRSRKLLLSCDEVIYKY